MTILLCIALVLAQPRFPAPFQASFLHSIRQHTLSLARPLVSCLSNPFRTSFPQTQFPHCRLPLS